MYSAVVFDLFGTLVPSIVLSTYRPAVARMAAALSAPEDLFSEMWITTTWPARRLGEHRSIEENVRFVCQQVDVHPSDVAVREAVAIRLAFTRTALVPGAGVLDVMRAIRSSSVRVGLVTNCGPDVPELWSECALADVVDYASFSSELGLGKPAPGIYEHCLRGLAVDPERCLYVGDGSDGELTGARDLGMDAVLLRIPFDDCHDSVRPEVASWSGPAVDGIHEIGRLVLKSDEGASFAPKEIGV